MSFLPNISSLLWLPSTLKWDSLRTRSSVFLSVKRNLRKADELQAPGHLKDLQG